MRLPVAILLAALLLPAASAGRESAPEVEDSSDRPIGAGDLLAAWIDGHRDGLLVTFKVASIENDPKAIVYVLNLEIDGSTRASPTIGFDQAGRLRTDSGANARSWPNVDDALAIVAFEPGEPAYLAAVAPWGLYPGLEPGATVRVTSAYTSLCCENGRWVAPYDEGRAVGGTLEVEPFATRTAARALLPILVPAWVIPAIVATCAAGGLAGGAALAYATRPKAPQAPVVTSVAVQPAPKGERFLRARGKR